MYTEVIQSHASTDGMMRDVCDGSFVRSHPVFQQYPDALQLIIYHDEIEVCNPLGSSAGIHKLGNHSFNITVNMSCEHNYLPCSLLGVFYYLLANIRPEFRSTLSAMQLLAVVKADDLRTHGCHTLLTPFVQQMNLLARVCTHAYIFVHPATRTIVLY